MHFYAKKETKLNLKFRWKVYEERLIEILNNIILKIGITDKYSIHNSHGKTSVYNKKEA